MAPVFVHVNATTARIRKLGVGISHMNIYIYILICIYIHTYIHPHVMKPNEVGICGTLLMPTSV